MMVVFVATHTHTHTHTHTELQRMESLKYFLKPTAQQSVFSKSLLDKIGGKKIIDWTP